MVTTVGTEATLEELLEDLTRLEYDAVDAYQAAIDRLENPSYRSALSTFREDHLRHIQELSDALTKMGRTPPEGSDAKSLLTQGKVVIAALMGDEAILRAMRTNEDDTNTAYQRAVEHPNLPDDIREILTRGREDERRHCEWILATLKTT